jgi:hypothetical protein
MDFGLGPKPPKVRGLWSLASQEVTREAYTQGVITDQFGRSELAAISLNLTTYHTYYSSAENLLRVSIAPHF